MKHPRTTITFPPVCANCGERHLDLSPEDPEGDPGCDWDRMSGNGLGPAPRRFSINTRRRGYIGRPDTGERFHPLDLDSDLYRRTSSVVGFFVES